MPLALTTKPPKHGSRYNPIERYGCSIYAEPDYCKADGSRSIHVQRWYGIVRRSGEEPMKFIKHSRRQAIQAASTYAHQTYKANTGET